uniref:Anaphase-promoting complex subunit 4 WD40 domain-containing protein n=1 Tax=Chromera velia CCMP2878 TaxID=1169474 RepID=A0A0G4HZJ9_9ALVE|mmetsp:Transcript_10667/g.20678  ORF Transcript_10667/g.20678 Transcript_10667/m.20678 type:complete len:465 (+) Transcript_10667:164-1558(+)|eukprot:Cvel_1584.t1-p1 / transcript=Cvel_1584.t1 / gene=Cvel_1584 / organism=Chromera_velia_CCMP2878 / gene_product=Guanine nucleotide-binding protein subunit, putative / transcript_product=Guanine nucleotide-binding protein subunit, putative / location=Cvel_scaffold56:110509-116493(-) / protein_length=464 / sequence_SO=supercontig / SO=protein_coding / is_pseudo=false
MEGPTDPLFVLRGHSESVNSVRFIGIDRLLSGDASGDVCVWSLDSRRVSQRLKGSEHGVLFADLLRGSSQIILQAREGLVKVCDLEAGGAVVNQILTRSFSFAPVAVLGNDYHSVHPEERSREGFDFFGGKRENPFNWGGQEGVRFCSPLVCSPLEETGDLGVFDLRSHKREETAGGPVGRMQTVGAVLSGIAVKPEVRLKAPKSKIANGSVGMVMGLCGVAKLSPFSHVACAFESGEVSVFDIRQDKGALFAPTPALPQLQAAASLQVFRNQCWVAGAKGSLGVLRMTSDGQFSLQEVLEVYGKKGSEKGADRKAEEGPDLDLSYSDRLERIRGKPEELQDKMGTGTIAARTDGAIVALPGWDHRLRLFETKSRRLVASLRGHTGALQTCAFQPCTGVIASAGKDKGICVWDTYIETLVDEEPVRYMESSDTSPNFRGQPLLSNKIEYGMEIQQPRQVETQVA